MFKGFRDFILRGNIVDLAVAVVIGTAFTALVSQFTESFITPLIAVVTGGGEAGGQFTVNGQAFTYGAFGGAIVTFVIIAAVVYFAVVVPMNKIMARFEKPAVEELAEPTEAELLVEIRDLLRAQQRG
ncbi:MAG: large conductance mechanosensitive channel protein MscL [Pseudonocardiaceae bacterium]|nr:large conductance mechanosensitive channel protein MscL [Pseudonocardiaceae bacterium]